MSRRSRPRRCPPRFQPAAVSFSMLMHADILRISTFYEFLRGLLIFFGGCNGTKAHQGLPKLLRDGSEAVLTPAEVWAWAGSGSVFMKGAPVHHIRMVTMFSNPLKHCELESELEHGSGAICQEPFTNQYNNPRPQDNWWLGTLPVWRAVEGGPISPLAGTLST